MVFASQLKKIGMSLLLISATAAAQNHALPIPPSGVIGFNEAMLSPDYWIARAPAPNTVLMTPQQIDAINARTWAVDPMMHDLTKVGPNLSREQVLAWLKEAGMPPSKPVVDIKGNPVPAATIDAIQANAGADRIAASTPARYGLSVRRAQLRTLPTSFQTFASGQLLDVDTFQSGVLFPGEPVIIAHASVDGQWLLVDTTQGAAWVRTSDIAQGAAREVFAYVGKTPYRVVTGDAVRTVFTPEAPELSELQLDMGTRVPLAQLPAGDVVNGQVPYVSWAIELPVRRDDGTLDFKPALLQKVRDTAPGYLPLTRANIIRQGFKFLGERYGWGHDYNARDCSGFISDVYRSMGILLPPNAGAQGRSPAFKRRDFSAADTHQARVQAIMEAQVGDLIAVPGHVLMILGKVNGEPYVIQDVPYAVFRDPSGKIRMTKVNGVSVTPLLPLFADERTLYVDAMTSLVHVTAR